MKIPIITKSPEIVPLKSFVGKVLSPVSRLHAKFKTSNLAPLKKDTVQFSKVRGTNIDAIKTDEEYQQCLKVLMADKNWRRCWNDGLATIYEIGIMPYVGNADISREINYYLRTGKVIEKARFSEKTMKEYLRVIDYSLKKFDKKHGKYSGVVYRYGPMDAESDRVTLSYVSSSKKPIGAAFHSFYICNHRKQQPFNIIYTKHGHKIVNLQKKLYEYGLIDYLERLYHSVYNFVTEYEILLDPGVKYQKITELTPKMKRHQKKLLKTLEKIYGQNFNIGSVKINFYKEVR